MTNKQFIGVLTPSSNTALEPLTSAILADVPGVSAHFSRFRVTEISLRPQSVGQFDIGTILEAAKLLADAKVGVICWSGTAASWLGVEQDQALCKAIEQETGIPATTSVLALNELLVRDKIRKLGLVSPYIQEVQDLIIKNYAAHGIDCSAEAHLSLTVNHAFGLVAPETLADLLREVTRHKPDGLTVMCTNLRAAHLAHDLEEELGIPLYDSVSVVVWKALQMLGVPAGTVKGWGRLFD
ncbi:MAG TPA: Asp/Glu/hydantoin racemase [Castellaniella sp.]|uniref:maleate cis-trans isomerase family protein n=1 Tax=Castellaniella sp. TaxID=1955812 RepID=UPI002EF72011